MTDTKLIHIKFYKTTNPLKRYIMLPMWNWWKRRSFCGAPKYRK